MEVFIVFIVFMTGCQGLVILSVIMADSMAGDREIIDNYRKFGQVMIPIVGIYLLYKIVKKALKENGKH